MTTVVRDADIVVTPELLDRFWARVDQQADTRNSCWIWLGKRDAHGYGRMYVGGGRRHRMRRGAHRVSWTIHYGPIAPGVDILHRCDNPSCVRPTHLFQGTQADNIADAARKGRLVEPPFAATNREKDRCVSGHVFDEKNTGFRRRRVGGAGHRYCRQCGREARQRWYRARGESWREARRQRRREPERAT